MNFVQFVVLLIDGRTGEVVTRRIESLSSPRPDALWVDVGSARPDAANLSHTRAAIGTLVEAVLNLAWDRMKLSVAP